MASICDPYTKPFSGFDTVKSLVSKTAISSYYIQTRRFCQGCFYIEQDQRAASLNAPLATACESLSDPAGKARPHPWRILCSGLQLFLSWPLLPLCWLLGLASWQEGAVIQRDKNKSIKPVQHTSCIANRQFSLSSQPGRKHWSFGMESPFLFSYDLQRGQVFFKYFERALARKRTKLGAASESQGSCSSSRLLAVILKILWTQGEPP